jgi:hypothetical protein
MIRAYVVTGQINQGRTIELDEGLPGIVGKVRLTVEPLQIPERGIGWVKSLDHIHLQLESSGHVPSTREEIEDYIRTERQTWDD